MVNLISLSFVFARVIQLLQRCDAHVMQSKTYILSSEGGIG